MNIFIFIAGLGSFLIILLGATYSWWLEIILAAVSGGLMVFAVMKK